MNEPCLRNILIVDDEEDYRLVIRQFLSKSGYSCDLASDAFQALQILGSREREYDLVLSDVRMKGKDGLQLMAEAKTAYPHLAFIIMTGYAAEYTYSDIIDAGAADFIAKPFDMAELKAKLKRIDKEKGILRQLQRSNEQLAWEASINASLAEISRVMITPTSLEDISSLVLGHARHLTGSELGFVGFVDRKTGYYVCTAALESKASSTDQGTRECFVVNQPDGMLSRLIESQRPFFENTRSEGLKWPGSPDGERAIDRLLAVPAVADGELIGQVLLANSYRDYTDKDLKLIERMTGVFALVHQRKWAEDRLKLTYARLRKSMEQTINALVSAVELRDPSTAGHQRKVANLACDIAREIGLPEHNVEAIRLAGLVHDIGKVSVPAEILTKCSKISELEMKLIRSHPESGYEILKDIEFPWPIAEIVLQHHERMNGSGYPQGLSAKGVFIEARVIAVADVIEAMSSHRPYRPALGMDKAVEEIKMNRGILYDSEVVDGLLRVLSKRDFRLE